MMEDSFTDVSEAAGIFGGINGYGLGISIADFNQDGYPDIYVGNDFHEDDYYYINNGDGTFSDQLKNYFRAYDSDFPWGMTLADINHDGLPDIISLDMLPEDEVVLKTSEGDDNIQNQKLRTQKYGYHYQFTQKYAVCKSDKILAIPRNCTYLSGSRRNRLELEQFICRF